MKKIENRLGVARVQGENGGGGVAVVIKGQREDFFIMMEMFCIFTVSLPIFLLSYYPILTCIY